MNSKRQNEAPLAQSRARRIAGFILSCVFAVTLFEFVLRAIDLPLVEPADFVAGLDSNRAFEFDFETMWRFPEDPVAKWGPAAIDEVSNRFFCRGYEPATEKAANDIRVVCVGSSSVAGFALPVGWAFPILLERKLQAKYPSARVETVLCGIAGYSSEQQRALLNCRLSGFNPDLVVFLTGTHNDLALASERNDQENLDRLRPGRFRTIDLLRFRFKFLNEMLHEDSNANADEIVMTAEDQLTEDLRVPLPRFRENLDFMIDWVKNEGGEPLFILPYSTDKVSDRTKYRNEVISKVEEHGLNTVDLGKVAKKKSDWLDALHMSRQGHAVLATALMEKVVESKLLDDIDERLTQPGPEAKLLSVAPTQVTIGGSRTIHLKVSGIDDESITRVWCGGHLTRHKRVGDDEIEVTLPRIIPTRMASIELVTTKGRIFFPDAFEVLPPKLDVQVFPQEAGNNMAFILELPAIVEIAFIATIDPATEPVETPMGKIWLAKNDVWPNPDPLAKSFFNRRVFTHGATFQNGLWGTTWMSNKSLPSGTRLAIQGLLAVPSPGNFEPVCVTTPFFLTVP